MQIKKEVSIAVFIGLIIGAIIIGGIYRAKTALDSHLKNTSPTPSSLADTSTDSTSATGLPLKINSPEDGAVVTSSKLELSGTTNPGTYVTILTETNEYIIVPSDLGDFSQEITLVKGANSIAVTVYTREGDKTELTLNLVYTTADL